MSYNLTIITENSTSVLGFVQGVNSVLMLGYLGVLILLALTIVVFTSYLFLTNDAGASLVASSYIAFILSLVLRAVGLLPNTALFITLVLTSVIIAISYVTKR